jgi:hypothetical protein
MIRAVDTVPGFIATFSRDMVVHKDTAYFGVTRRELIELTLEFGQLAQLELLISGYDDDNRSLYEVPEVNRWMRLVQGRWPDMLFWLTPGSLWTVLLSLNPSLHTRLPDGRLQIAIDPETLLVQLVESYAAAEDVLTTAGMKKKPLGAATSQAQQNFMHMLERKQLGTDYIVVHPKQKTIVKYEGTS